jgi:hypothetical protein
MSRNQLDTYVHKAENLIPLELPEGEWFLELNSFEDKGAWYKSSTPVVVRKSGGPFEINLRLTK